MKFSFILVKTPVPVTFAIVSFFVELLSSAGGFDFLPELDFKPVCNVFLCFLCLIFRYVSLSWRLLQVDSERPPFFRVGPWFSKARVNLRQTLISSTSRNTYPSLGVRLFLSCMCLFAGKKQRLKCCFKNVTCLFICTWTDKNEVYAFPLHVCIGVDFVPRFKSLN